MRKSWIVCAAVIVIFSAFNHFQIDKTKFYKALSAGSEEMIDNELSNLDNIRQSSQITAYHGALLMKKAGFEKGVKNKVKTFKKGAAELEGEIGKNASNVEYRFLRLTIQEHAPAILKYNKNLNDDKAAVIVGYDKVDPVLKSVILNYAKDSKILKESDLRNK